MTATLRAIGIDDRAAWLTVLSNVADYDVYHLPEYHEVAERGGEGLARLFVYARGGHTIALPLLLRPCAGIEGLEGESALDATSVYGYAGPVSSHADPPAPVLAGFHAGLRDALRQLGVVAAFSRLHPLIPQRRLVAGLGETVPSGTTVSIDLTLPPDAQTTQYRHDHRMNIKRLRRLGGRCIRRASGPALDSFFRMYHETMQRVGADPYYFFDRPYFDRLRDLLGPRVDLSSCVVDDQVVSAALFLSCNGIVQYHLGGTSAEWLRLSPMKLVLDDARCWAAERGMRVLHLGGGVGAQEDSLFHFKAGFSDRRHPFAIWRWVLDEGHYRRLVERKSAWNAEHGVGARSAAYFPLYRSPTEPISTVVDDQRLK